ncbi:hypothetical protein Belba_0454 [Belliella baltica DSM 15883]|uniref:Uncharacterized protein n=1 Tax=Belliella baltica (strain DSM 15883 / CIP 108006 / LMG 21964 / BA134) TaxID=866536 RepID=I3Z1J5_BELBD|nr:hypothetical protein [Belliella baltica]AFL83113.1 hypothetical protein Belba_0454 [Belliella baltica DSM 15883]
MKYLTIASILFFLTFTDLFSQELIQKLDVSVNELEGFKFDQLCSDGENVFTLGNSTDGYFLFEFSRNSVKRKIEIPLGIPHSYKIFEKSIHVYTTMPSKIFIFNRKDNKLEKEFLVKSPLNMVLEHVFDSDESGNYWFYTTAPFSIPGKANELKSTSVIFQGNIENAQNKEISRFKFSDDIDYLSVKKIGQKIYLLNRNDSLLKSLDYGFLQKEQLIPINKIKRSYIQPEKLSIDEIKKMTSQERSESMGYKYSDFVVIEDEIITLSSRIVASNEYHIIGGRINSKKDIYNSISLNGLNFDSEGKYFGHRVIANHIHFFKGMVKDLK